MNPHKVLPEVLGPINVTPSTPRLRRSPLFIVALALVSVKLWLVAAQPVVAHGNARCDDRLFLELANHLLNGEWLGPYSQLTLVKGPMYSLWIGVTFLLGVPLPLAQHLLYLLACTLLVLALRPCLSRRWQLALFTLLWWQPMSYVQLDILRQNFYTPVTLLLFAGLCALETRRGAGTRTRLAWGALLGISAGVFWLTREEGVFVLPAAALLVGSASWNSWRLGERFGPLFAPLLGAAVCAAGILGTVCALNYRYYGWFGTVELRAPEFLSAYGALQRPIPSEELPYTSVTRETRLKLYDASPAFAELQPSLEGTIGLEWAAASEFLPGRPLEAREIAGGWLMWALRDAVAAAGHAHSAREALDFYDRIGSEVNRACDEGRVGATGRRRDTMVPPWRPQHTQRLHETTVDYVEYFFLFRGFTAYPTPSNGQVQLLGLFRDLTRWPLAPSAEAPELDLPLQSRVDYWRLATLQAVGNAFRWVCAALAVTGFGAWVWTANRMIRRRVGTYLFLVATAALGSALGVMLINLLVHVLSYPNQDTSSLAVGYPLLVLFGATAWIAATLPQVPAEAVNPCQPIPQPSAEADSEERAFARD